MLTFEKVEDTVQSVKYRYFPEGKSKYGFVSYDKAAAKFSFDLGIASSYGTVYAAHMRLRMKEYLLSGIFEDSGTVAWY